VSNSISTTQASGNISSGNCLLLHYQKKRSEKARPADEIRHHYDLRGHQIVDCQWFMIREAWRISCRICTVTTSSGRFLDDIALDLDVSSCGEASQTAQHNPHSNKSSSLMAYLSRTTYHSYRNQGNTSPATINHPQGILPWSRQLSSPLGPDPTWGLQPTNSSSSSSSIRLSAPGKKDLHGILELSAPAYRLQRAVLAVRTL
jgi:hypothetical protein